MKLLFLHCDYIKFKPLKKALKSAGELSENEKKEQEVKECLVVLTAVEKGDSVKNVKDLIENVKDVAGQVKAKNIVLYPYAHLSSNLANPEIALHVLEESGKQLKKDFEVYRAPFGYYKEFELKVKGHPLSELSREIPASKIAKSILSGEIKIESKGKESVDEKIDIKQLLNEISKSRLDTSKLRDNDHRILGQQMDLFSFNEVAPGMVFWHNNGLVIKDELIKFWKEVHKKQGYKEISTPQVMDKRLWQISGHWDKYGESNFLTSYNNRPFIVKPMNCPGGMLVYRNGTKSYKDLPLRVGELGIVHRQELSGVLAGLFRVVQFTQDDAHIFCTEEQLEEEVIAIIDLIDFFYKKFKIDFDHIELSTRPEKRIGSDKDWDKAEKLLESVLKKKKMKYKINKGDGAFYGPKIDFHVKDSLGRTWQLSTIQLDFSMPERFELEYIDKDNTRKRPVMLHRVIYGALERFIGVYLEHTNGRLPTWLAPIQVRVLSFTNRSDKYARQVIKKLSEIEGLRIDSDLRDVPIPGKVKDAELMRISYIVVVGDKEEKEKTIAVRRGGKIKAFKIDGFVKQIKEEIDKRQSL